MRKDKAQAAVETSRLALETRAAQLRVKDPKLTEAQSRANARRHMPDVAAIERSAGVLVSRLEAVEKKPAASYRT